MKPFMLQRNIP